MKADFPIRGKSAGDARSEWERIAGKPGQPKAGVKPAPSAADKKIAKLREMRLADEAHRRAAGTWGDLSVGEFRHPTQDECFVIRWSGRTAPSVATQLKAKAACMTAAEGAALIAWVGTRAPIFVCTVIAANLSENEANRVMQARIAEHRQAGRKVFNPQ